MAVHLADCSWTWWCRPRAVQCGNYTYICSARDNGTRAIDVIASDKTVKRMRITTNATPDDHVNGAVVAVAGKPLVIFYQDHNLGVNTYIYKAAWNADVLNGIYPITFNTSLNWGAGTIVNFSMALPDAANNTIHLFSTLTNRNQVYARSENWATDFSAQPASPATIWFDAGSTFQPGNTASFGFCNYRQLDSDPTKCRVLLGIGYESARSVRYAEMNLATGDITNTAGTVLGNLRTGVGLPLTETQLDLVFTAPAGSCINYCTDVLGGTNPEGVFGTYDLTNPDTNSFYYWCQRVGSTWTVEQIVNKGPRFTTAPSTGYHSEAQLLSSGNVLLGRTPNGGAGGGFVNGMWVGSPWNLEKWTRSGPNAWAATVLQTDPTNPLVRVYPVEGSGPFTYVYNRLTRFSQYTDFSGELIVV
jgi:hypothetical protein